MPSSAEYRQWQIDSLQSLSVFGGDDERSAVRYAITAISTEVALSARVKELAQENAELQDEVKRRSENESWLEKRNLWLNGQIAGLKAARPNRTAMPDWRTKPPTQKQIAWMESVGMDPTGYNRGQIADLVGFAKKTLATVRERVLDIPEFHDFHPFEQGDGWDGWWNE